MARLSLWLVALFCLSGLFYNLQNYPPYFDFDAATDAILVNNLTEKRAYDFYFRDSSVGQDNVRALYASHRLPFSLPLSLLQRLLSVEHQELDIFFKTVSAVLALLGLIFVYRLAHQRFSSAIIPLFVACGTLVHPVFFLHVRTGLPHWMLSFLLFWSSIFFVFQYTEKRKPYVLYLLAIVLAYFVLNPYPSILILPFCFGAILLLKRTFLYALKDKHSYFALIFCVVLSFGSSLGIGEYFESSFSEYSTRVTEFRNHRSFTVSIEKQFVRGDIQEKLTKYFNQYVLFQRDALGDRSREDNQGTLGFFYWPVVLLLPLFFFGCFQALKQREGVSLVFASVFIFSILFFLTISFPESRYTLVVIPCYFYFAGIGLERIVSQDQWRSFVVVFLLLLFSGTTFWVTTHSYNEYMKEEWRDLDGIKELAQVMPERQEGTEEILLLPVLRHYKTWLYVMLMLDFRVEWPNEAVTAEQLRVAKKNNQRYFYVEPSLEGGCGVNFREVSWAQIAKYQSSITGREFLLCELEKE